MNRVVKHNQIIIRLFFVCLFLVTATSCRNEDIYYQFHEIKKQKWSKYDTLFFYIDSALINPSVKYDITVELTNSFDYPYRNIWLYSQDNINDTIFRNYSAQHLLSDEFGKWYGSGFGALYQLSLPYRTSVYFKDNRSYCIKLVHGMRDEPLLGIENVGIRIKETE